MKWTGRKMVALVMVVLLGFGTLALAQSTQQAGDWLEGQQDVTGWFPWQPGGGATTNTQGPSALGLLSAWMHTGIQGFLDGAVLTGEYILNTLYTPSTGLRLYADGTPRFAMHDPLYLVSLSEATGDSTYADFVDDYYWDLLEAGAYGDANYDAAALGAYVVSVRGQLSMWDIAPAAIAAHLAGRVDIRDAFMGAILDGLEAAAGPGSYDVAGLAGAVWASAATGGDLSPTVGRYAGLDTAGLAEALADMTTTDNSGAWLWQSAADPAYLDNGDLQNTAFAIMGLYAADPVQYGEQIARGVAFIRSLQLGDGAFLSYVGADPATWVYVESHAEALSAIAAVAPTVVYVDQDNTGLSWGDDPVGLGIIVGYDAFATVVDGVDGARADGTVAIQPGVFVEQVVISKDLTLAGSGTGTVVQAPDTLTEYFTTGTNRNHPIIFVHNTDDVTIQDLVVDGAGKGNANVRFIGIGFYNAGGTVENVEIVGIRNTPFSGAQHGVALYAYNDDGTPRELNVIGNLIYDFQKNAMALSGDGLTVNVVGNTIIGAGPTDVTAQNGIQVGWGATGTVQGNTVSGIYYTGSGWGASGILIAAAAPGVEAADNIVLGSQFGIYMESADAVIDGNLVDGSDYGLMLYHSNIAVTGNDLLNSYVGAYLLSGHALGALERNVIVGNTYGAYLAGDVGVPVRYNVFSGNTYGFYPAVSSVDAALNWWGSAAGPTVASNPDGDGDTIYGNVIYSPWLGTNPDGDPTLPGVQITEPLYIVVSPVGPEPTGGYLNMAIVGANEIAGVGAHTVGVHAGTYDAGEPITNPVSLLNEGGTAAGTVLTGPMSLDTGGVRLGRLGQGFTILGPITVGAGVDASTIHINWNCIFDAVINEGEKRLDARFNYWGEDGPETVGPVNVRPILPVCVDTIIEYMEEHGLTAMEAILFATLMQNTGTRNALLVLQLNQLGFTEEQAWGLIVEHGVPRVTRAVQSARGSYDRFVLNLFGYAMGAPVGGGGGEDGGTEVHTVGDTVEITLDLVHPITGEPLTTGTATVSVFTTDEDGGKRFVALGIMYYSEEEGQFVYDLDTTGYGPGIYEIILGIPATDHHTFYIELVDPV